MSSVPVLDGAAVRRAVSPARAVDAVREAFIAHARGEWTMPPKVYVTNYPAGDFRAMPALGNGYALLKWITSFPGNPAQGLPTVTGVVLVSDASNGELRAVLDAAPVTALRPGAAAVLASEVFGRADASTAAVVGVGVNGQASAATFLARGQAVSLWDVDTDRAARVASELGAEVAPSLEHALAADLLVTVTPGHEVLLHEGALRPGQHVSLMGADGPGKAEASAPELERAHLFCDDWEKGESELIPERRLFCDDWEQASHGGELAHVFEDGLITRDDVIEIGQVLTGEQPGRQHEKDITLFDSTGLAIQDLAIAIAALESADLASLPRFTL